MVRVYLILSVTTNILFMLMKLILIYTAEEVEGVYDVDKELSLRCQTGRAQIFYCGLRFVNGFEVLATEARRIQEGRFPGDLEALSSCSCK